MEIGVSWKKIHLSPIFFLKPNHSSTSCNKAREVSCCINFHQHNLMWDWSAAMIDKIVGVKGIYKERKCGSKLALLQTKYERSSYRRACQNRRKTVTLLHKTCKSESKNERLYWRHCWNPWRWAPPTMHEQTNSLLQRHFIGLQLCWKQWLHF